jgi:hypothetical protein
VSSPSVPVKLDGRIREYKLTQIEPAMIAYAAFHVSLVSSLLTFDHIISQTRWMLCSESSLKVTDSTFDYDEFYRTILKLFDDGDFAEHVLGEYNKYVLTLTSSSSMAYHKQ